jgi:hypothetical protein
VCGPPVIADSRYEVLVQLLTWERAPKPLISNEITYSAFELSIIFGPKKNRFREMKDVTESGTFQILLELFNPTSAEVKKTWKSPWRSA